MELYTFSLNRNFNSKEELSFFFFLPEVAAAMQNKEFTFIWSFLLGIPWLKLSGYLSMETPEWLGERRSFSSTWINEYTRLRKQAPCKDSAPTAAQSAGSRVPGLPAPCLPAVGSERGETLNSFLAMRFLTLYVSDLTWALVERMSSAAGGTCSWKRTF